MKSKLLILMSGLVGFYAPYVSADDEDAPTRPKRPAPEEIVAELMVNFDADESNALDSEELRLAMEDLRNKQRQRMEGMRQRNRDGGGDGPQRQERQERVGKRDGERRGGGDPEARHQAVFSRFDEDQNGSLDSGELLGLVDQLNRGRRNGPGGPRRGPPLAEGSESN